MIDDDRRRNEEVWNSLDTDIRIAVASHLISKVVEVGSHGCSFRYFIYDMLGFGPEAYVPLYIAGGMEITNEFDIEKVRAIEEIVAEHKIEVLKETLGLCDEHGCFKKQSTGWPSGEEYRRTCSDHYAYVERMKPV